MEDTSIRFGYLSQRISEAESPEKRQQIITAVTNGSVVSWQHVNLPGEYDFSDEKLEDSVGLEFPKILDLNVLYLPAVAACLRPHGQAKASPSVHAYKFLDQVRNHLTC